MKVKLLKKLRKRFKWSFTGRLRLDKYAIWTLIDRKAISKEIISDSILSYDNQGVRIHGASVAEQLAMRVKGVIWLYYRRQKKLKLSNKRFERKHFS